VLEEVVVTGTSIRGVAPIGSNVITVDQAAMQAVGAVSVSQLVNTVPAITTANSAPQGENVFSYYSPQIHSLGGSASCGCRAAARSTPKQTQTSYQPWR
jgi:iron complex outermembrane receptor protein